MKKTKIFIASHKDYPMPKDDIFQPIQVGTANNFEKFDGFLGDDEFSDNISKKNPYYNELTAVYYILKNMKDYDYVGLVHYRRNFSNGGEFLNNDSFLELIGDKDVLLPKKRNYYIESNYSHYIHAHKKMPLDLTRKIIVRKFPDYIDDYDLVMSKKSAHMFNIFVMKSDIFKQYAEWLFNILEDLESEIQVEVETWSQNEQRVYGFISELLLDVWINHNNISYAESKLMYLEREQIAKKVYKFILRKIGINRPDNGK